MQFTVASALRFLDALFKVMDPKEDIHCKQLNDAEIATTVIIAALPFYGNQAAAAAFAYMQRHYGMKRIHKSGRFADAI